MARIGLMGGTFNPIHLGHLLLAQEACHAFSLDRVLFIPNYRPPHKQGELASGHHRYIMACLAVAGMRRFHVSNVELERGEVSYTCDTLELLPREDDYVFITGADSLMVSWRNLDQILGRVARFVVATRPGFPFSALEKRLDTLGLSNRARITRLEMPAFDISSTEIRRRVREGIPIDLLVPTPVADYIHKHDLYLSTC